MVGAGDASRRASRHHGRFREARTPDIKVTLVSGPYSATHDQIVVGAASGTLSDVVGLDGAWVNGLAKQGAIASMDPLMDAASYDRSQIADIIKVDGKSVMFPLASFVYPVFVNLDLAKAAGVDSMPPTAPSSPKRRRR